MDEVTHPTLELPGEEGSHTLPESRECAVAALRHGLRDLEPLLFLHGPAGVGKSTVLDAALAAGNAGAKRIIRLDRPPLPSWTPNVLARQLLGRHLGPSPDDFSPTPDDFFVETNSAAPDRAALTEAAIGRARAVIAVDDAHALTDEAMELLLLMASPTRRDGPPPQVVLSGRGEFWDRPWRGELRMIAGLAERVTLGPLGDDEAADHVARFMRRSGAALSFEATAVVLRHAAGIPARIERALAAAIAIGACRDGGPLSGDVMRDAIASLASVPVAPRSVAAFLAPPESRFDGMTRFDDARGRHSVGERNPSGTRNPAGTRSAPAPDDWAHSGPEIAPVPDPVVPALDDPAAAIAGSELAFDSASTPDSASTGGPAPVVDASRVPDAGVAFSGIAPSRRLETPFPSRAPASLVAGGASGRGRTLRLAATAVVLLAFGGIASMPPAQRARLLGAVEKPWPRGEGGLAGVPSARIPPGHAAAEGEHASMTTTPPASVALAEPPVGSSSASAVQASAPGGNVPGESGPGVSGPGNRASNAASSASDPVTIAAIPVEPDTVAPLPAPAATEGTSAPDVGSPSPIEAVAVANIPSAAAPPPVETEASSAMAGTAPRTVMGDVSPETVRPEPTSPGLASPEPVSPEPTFPESAKPELTKPEPAKPELAKPELAKPEQTGAVAPTQTPPSSASDPIPAMVATTPEPAVGASPATAKPEPFKSEPVRPETPAAAAPAKTVQPPEAPASEPSVPQRRPQLALVVAPPPLDRKPSPRAGAEPAAASINLPPVKLPAVNSPPILATSILASPILAPPARAPAIGAPVTGVPLTGRPLIGVPPVGARPVAAPPIGGLPSGASSRNTPSLNTPSANEPTRPRAVLAANVPAATALAANGTTAAPRCQGILRRAGLGEELSNEDRIFLRGGCRAPR